MRDKNGNRINLLKTICINIGYLDLTKEKIDDKIFLTTDKLNNPIYESNDGNINIGDIFYLSFKNIDIEYYYIKNDYGEKIEIKYIGFIEKKYKFETISTGNSNFIANTNRKDIYIIPKFSYINFFPNLNYDTKNAIKIKFAIKRNKIKIPIYILKNKINIDYLNNLNIKFIENNFVYKIINNNEMILR